jgi:formylmethanofuran dehydrogenase subunit E
MSIKKYNVQNTVHLFPVPFELAEIINSFLFFEIKKISKERKNFCLRVMIDYCTYSRINEIQYFSNQGWYILLNNGKIIMSINCNKCGNYISENNIVAYNKNIVCFCLM